MESLLPDGSVILRIFAFLCVYARLRILVQLTHELLAPIRRTVVEDDDFHDRIALLHDADKALFEVSLVVVVRNDVIEYVLAKYPCAAAHYWKNVDQRQLVITLCKCKLVDVRLCLRNWEEKHQRSKFPYSLILSAKNTLSIN